MFTHVGTRRSYVEFLRKKALLNKYFALIQSKKARSITAYFLASISGEPSLQAMFNPEENLHIIAILYIHTILHK